MRAISNRELQDACVPGKRKSSHSEGKMRDLIPDAMKPLRAYDRKVNDKREQRPSPK
jgi:hypothetical protein